MKQILRCLTYLEQQEKDEAKLNAGKTRLERFLWMSKTETTLMDWAIDFFVNSGEAPSLRMMINHFEKAGAAEEATLLDEVAKEQFLNGASYSKIMEDEVETQATFNLGEVLKVAGKIATQGAEVNRVKVKGVDEAASYLITTVQGKPPDSTGRMSSNMRDNSQALWDDYHDKKTNPATARGIMSGYGIIDQATYGFKKKEFFLLAGFTGHLKSTLMANMILNSATAGWNPFLATSEMPADRMQQMLICMHSADKKFNGVFQPVPFNRLSQGALSPEQETAYKEVKDDLINNPDHGLIRVLDSGDFTTFGSIQQQVLRAHVEEEVDILWIDYLTRLPVDTKYRGMQITEARNETIADAKRFSMSFDHGVGLPVCTPFQVNREGFKRAKDASGKMDIRALAQYNAAEKEADSVAYSWFDEDEQATSEPKIGIIKARWGKVPADPASAFIEPETRRIFDLTSGMATMSLSPVGGGEDEVVI